MEIRIEPDRSDMVFHYGGAKDQPNWTLWTLYNSQTACQFGVRKKWTKEDAVKHVDEVLAPFRIQIPESVKQTQDVDVFVVTIVEVDTRHRHRVKIASTGSPFRFSEDEETNYYLMTDSSVGQLLTPGLQAGQVLVIFGGILHSEANVYTLRLKCLIKGKNVYHSSFHILHFLGTIGPKDLLQPYATKLDRGAYQLQYFFNEKGTLLNAIPAAGQVEQLTRTPESKLDSSSKQKRKRVWEELEHVTESANLEEVQEIERSPYRPPHPSKKGKLFVIAHPKGPNLNTLYSRTSHVRNKSSDEEN